MFLRVLSKAATADKFTLRRPTKRRIFAINPFRQRKSLYCGSPHANRTGCDVWTHAKIAGWGNIAISTRYVHPSEQAVLRAYSQMGGHNSGHSAENAPSVPSKKTACKC